MKFEIDIQGTSRTLWRCLRDIVHAGVVVSKLAFQLVTLSLACLGCLLVLWLAVDRLREGPLPWSRVDSRQQIRDLVRAETERSITRRPTLIAQVRASGPRRHCRDCGTPYATILDSASVLEADLQISAVGTARSQASSDELDDLFGSPRAD